MSLHKPYLLLLVLTYLLLLVIFHLQLQTPDNLNPDARLTNIYPGPSHTNQPLTNQYVSLVDGTLNNETFHRRDLMLSNNEEIYKARSEYGKALLKGKHQASSTTKQHENIEQDKQVPAPQLYNDNLVRLIKVARTFQNGTRPVKEVIRLPEEIGERLELQGVSDPERIDASISFERNISINQHHHSVQTPFSSQCYQYFATQQQKIFTVVDKVQDLKGIRIISAYLDARLPDEPPFVRMIGLLKRARRPQLYCHFPHKSPGGTTFVTEVALFYEMCENHNKDYGGWIISCKVPSVLTEQGKIPCEVIVSRETTFDALSTGGIPVSIYTTQLQKDFEATSDNLNFAVCVPPLFGHIPSSTLVEFVELNRLLGVSHMIIYAHQVKLSIQKVLEYYQKQGLVTVISWDLPVQDRSIWYHGQLLAINDCLYRTMHRFSHVVFNDIDEFLVPHVHDTLHGLVKHLEMFGSEAVNNTKYSGFIFQSAFFDPLVNGNSKILYDLESDLRTKIFSQVRAKVLVRPYRIFELGIHHISRPFKDKYRTESVDPKVAFIHHYRKCTVDFDPQMKCHVYARDESISRYVPALRHNVHKTLWILKDLGG